MGFPLAEVTGRSATPIDIPAEDKVDFYFKCSPSPDGKGFDTEPALVHCRRHEEARDGRAIDGTLTLHDSPLDPIADIPVGRDRVDAVRAGRRPRSTARSSSGCRPTGSCPSCTSATTTSRCSGRRTDRDRRRRARTRSSRPTRTRACRARSTGRTSTRGTTTRSTSSSPSGTRNRDEQMKLNYDYITNWETDARRRAARRVRRRAARQGDGRRRRRRRGDLPRRRRDHRDGVTTVRRRPVGRHDRGSRARVRRRTRAQPLPRRAVRDEPDRRGGVGLVPISHDVDARRRRDRVAGRNARASAGS